MNEVIRRDHSTRSFDQINKKIIKKNMKTKNDRSIWYRYISLSIIDGVLMYVVNGAQAQGRGRKEEGETAISSVCIKEGVVLRADSP